MHGHQSRRRAHTLLNYLSFFIRWHMAKLCQRLHVEIQECGPQNKWLLFFEQPPLAEYLEYTQRVRAAISDQPSHNTSPSITWDNEFSCDANKRVVLFSATSQVFWICVWDLCISWQVYSTSLSSGIVENFLFDSSKCQKVVETLSCAKICFVFSRWLIKIKGISLGGGC